MPTAIGKWVISEMTVFARFLIVINVLHEVHLEGLETQANSLSIVNKQKQNPGNT